MALPLDATQFERVQKERLIIRNFQCRGNSPYCHRVNQNAQGTYKQSILHRDLDVKRKVRSKREGTSLDAMALELQERKRITVEDLRHVKLERIKLGLTRQNNQWTRALWQCRFLSDKELGILYRYFFNGQAERTCKIGLDRMKRVYERWNRDLPVHHKFQVKLLFSKQANLKSEFFKATKEWLGKEPKLLGT